MKIYLLIFLPLCMFLSHVKADGVIYIHFPNSHASMEVKVKKNILAELPLSISSCGKNYTVKVQHDAISHINIEQDCSLTVSHYTL
ncbi:MAG: hypothetical protein K2P93_05830 [Alphaproteobacteria bacterium]|nr:hypothetical protein [Alphaproteobacteria bacterium]